MSYLEKPTQEQRILNVLLAANGQWVDGMTFLNYPAITQYHARIWALQRKGHIIEGRFVEGKNWKEYRLLQELKQPALFYVAPAQK